MRSKRAVIAIVAVCMLAAVAGAWWMLRGGAAGTIRITTFNAEGLLDEGDASVLEEVARAIRSADPDILAIQNVADEQAVRDFVATYLSGLSLEHIAAPDSGREDGQRCAIVSRWPIDEARVFPDLELIGEHPRTLDGKSNPFRGEPMRFRTAPLLATIDTPSGRVGVLSIDHKGGNRFSYWREAEARGVAQILRVHASDASAIVCASMHDESGAPVLDAYAREGLIDPIETDAKRKALASEPSGDRTDFVLVRREDEHQVRASGTRVDELDLDLEDLHYPLTIEYRPRRD